MKFSHSVSWLQGATPFMVAGLGQLGAEIPSDGLGGDPPSGRRKTVSTGARDRLRLAILKGTNLIILG